MKKISIIAAATALTLSQGVFAKDIAEGTFSFSGATGGGMSFINSEVDAADAEFDTFTLELETFARYFIQENIALGVGFEYSNTNTEYDGGNEDEETSLILKPGIFYNHSLNEDNGIIFGATLDIGSIEYSSTGSETTEFDVSGITFGGIFQHFVTENVTLDASATYSMLTLEEDASGFEVDSSGLTFGVGATFYFSK